MISFRESNFKRALKNLFLRRKNDVVVLEPRAGLGDTLLCIGLIKELSKKYPSLLFQYDYCEEDNQYSGFHIIRNGKMLELYYNDILEEKENLPNLIKTIKDLDKEYNQKHPSFIIKLKNAKSDNIASLLGQIK